MSLPQPVLSPEELADYIAEIYPQIMEQFPGFAILSIEPAKVVVALDTDQRHVRAGGTVSGPTIFALADMGGYACVLSHVGRQALAVTTNLNINFMRKAPPGRLEGHCRILKLGKRLMVFEIDVRQEGSMDSVAHATGTYAIPPK